MHKCPNCGQEFEGKFCPECGTQWLEEKPCPQCGKVLKGSAKFCTECGNSFITKPQTTTQPKEPKEPSKFAVCAKTCLDWSKNHLKIVILSGLGLVLVIVLLCLIPTFIAMQTNGTYYKLGYNGEIDRQTYFILKSGTWTDEDGETGKYEINGENITFYFEFFGMQDETQGTLKDRVLKVNGDTFVSDKHKHKFEEYTVTLQGDCYNNGTETAICSCGVKDVRETPKVHNFVEFEFDENNHWSECSICGETIEGAHTKDCECGYPLNYKLNADGESYYVSSFRNDTHFEIWSMGQVYNYTEIVIPSTYKGLPVTKIGSNAFSGHEELKNITIPDSVTSIGTDAFSGCSGLTSVTIPDSVTTIGGNAFYKCSGLTSIKVGSNNTAYYSKDNCLIERESKTLILGCKNSIIPDDITTIGANAFWGCSGLTSVTIPDSVTTIGKYAFYNCSGLTSVTIPGSVTKIDEYVFYGCSGLTGVIVPDSVTSIGKYAFEYCSGLTSVTIGNGVTTIGEYAFYNCSGLTGELTIPDSVTTIGANAFQGCSGLTSVTIGNGVTEIGAWVFYNCSGLTDINYNGTKAQWAAMSRYWSTNTGNYTVHCTDGDIDKANS